MPFGKKTEAPEYFLALNIGLSEVTGVLWEVIGDKLDIAGKSSSSYSGTPELVRKSHQVLDEALGESLADPHKILFGVPDLWTSEDNLKDEYLKILKQMVREFDLEPLAYVTTTHAITHLLQKKEGIPPTSLLLGIGEYLEISLVRGGKIIESRSGRKSDHFFDDLSKILGQFTDVEVFPSKILLYSTKAGENIEKFKDELMSYPLMTKFSFLHFPKIEVLDEDILSEAVAFAGGAELNPEIDLKHSFKIYNRFARTPHFSAGGEGEGRFQASAVNLVNKAEVYKNGATHPSRTFGPKELLSHRSHPFEDLQNLPASETPKTGLEGLKRLERKKEVQDTEGSGRTGNEESFGFIAGDIEGRTLSRKEERVEGPGRAEISNILDSDEGVEEVWNPKPSEYLQDSAVNFESQIGKLSGNKLKSLFAPLLAIFHKFWSHLSWHGGKVGSRMIGPLGIGVLVLLLLLGSYLFLNKATIAIFVEPKILEREAQVVADPKISAVDEANNVIPGKVVETTVSGSGKESASGQKLIGNPARGKVVVYNLTNSRVTVASGTALSGPGNLKFTLDTGAQIASQSSTVGSDFTTVLKPGKTDPIGASASTIGPESNLPAGTELSVGSYTKSQVVARIDEALSGGTSKTVTIVTSDDQKKLQAKILSELRSQAEQDLQGKLDSDQKVISEALTVVDSKYSFNKSVNDQASEFSVTSTIKFKGTAYSEEHLRAMVGKLVGDNVPDGYKLNLADTETQAEVAKVEKDGKLIFKARFRAKLMPDYNLEDVKKSIRGKSVSATALKIRELENVVSTEIRVSPSLPAFLSRLPFLTKNITITVSPK
ncbi:MAG: hypothetical protein Q7S88_01605 [Candidatus Daviesbacteria bacterium]|nr:hypothetical protein [Candidatus Daviesbacteria bacterium]